MKLPFIEIIAWVEQSPNLMMWEFPAGDAEIKNGAKLTVRESERALLLNEGQLADIFEPGLYTLNTENIPLLTRLKGWKYGFKSPFKADVYFFSTKQFVNLKWGTPAPIMMRDSQFGQVRVRAFGSYNVRIIDVAKFFREYAGTYPMLTVMELQHQLRDYIAPRFGEVLSVANIPVVEVAGSLDVLNGKIKPLIQPYFDEFGIEITEFVVSSVTLPEEVTAHFDKVTNMNMVTDVDKYMKFNQASAIGEKGTALNDGAMQAAALGMVMGTLNTQSSPKSLGGQAGAQADDEIVAKLKQLKALFESELIDSDEYKSKKAELISKL